METLRNANSVQQPPPQLDPTMSASGRTPSAPMHQEAGLLRVMHRLLCQLGKRGHRADRTAPRLQQPCRHLKLRRRTELSRARRHVAQRREAPHHEQRLVLELQPEGGLEVPMVIRATQSWQPAVARARGTPTALKTSLQHARARAQSMLLARVMPLQQRAAILETCLTQQNATWRQPQLTSKRGLYMLQWIMQPHF